MTPTKTRIDRIAELLLSALNDEQDGDVPVRQDVRRARREAARSRKKSA